MGEDQGGAALHQPIEGLLDDRLALGVDRRQRLVEDQDGRVAEEGAGDGDALALAAGQAHPALAHDGLIALGQARDELVGVGRPRRRLQLRRRRLGLAHAQVLLHGAVEEIRVLAHDGDGAAQLVDAQVAHVLAAHQHPSALGVVEAEEEPGNGRLAGAARPHDAHALAGPHREAQALVGGLASAGVGEHDALELHGRNEPLVARGGPGYLADRRPRVEDAEDPLGRGESQHALMEQDAQLAQGAEHLHAEHEDHEQDGQVHLAGPHAIGAPAEGHRRAHRDAGVGDAARHRVGAEHPHRAPEELPAARLQHLQPGRALAEGLQGGQALDGVEELRGEGAVGLRARQAGRGVLAMPEGRSQQGDDGRHQQHQRDGEIEEGHEREDEDRASARPPRAAAGTGRSRSRAAARPPPWRRGRRRCGSG